MIELLYAAASLSGLKLFCWSLNGLELCSVADLVYEESCINSALAIYIIEVLSVHYVLHSLIESYFLSTLENLKGPPLKL